LNEKDSLIIWNTTKDSVIEPFKRDDQILENSLFRLGRFEEFVKKSPRILGGGFDWNEFDPELIVQANEFELYNATGLKPDECSISIVVRDKALKRFCCPIDKNLKDLNGYEISLKETFGELSRSEHFEVSIYARPSNDGQRAENVAQSRFQIVAQKNFKITSELDTTRIPVVWVDEERMMDRAGSRDCIWRIEWADEPKDNESNRIYDFSLNDDIINILEIWINERYRKFFKKREKSPAEASIFKKQMLSEIYQSIFARICESDEPITNPRGLIALADSYLSRTGNMSLDELRHSMQNKDQQALLRSVGVGISGLRNELLGIKRGGK